MHVSGQTEIFWLQDFICRRIGEDGFGMNAGFVRERTKTSDVANLPE